MASLFNVVFWAATLATFVLGARVDDEPFFPTFPPSPSIPTEWNVPKVGTDLSDVRMAEAEYASQRDITVKAAAVDSKALDQVRLADDLNRRARDVAMAKGALESEAVASREAAARATAVAVARHEATKVAEDKAKRARDAIAYAAKKAADTMAAKSYADKTKSEAEESLITSKRMAVKANLMSATAAHQKSEFDRVAAMAADAKAQAKMAVMEKDAATADLKRMCKEDVGPSEANTTLSECEELHRIKVVQEKEQADCAKVPAVVPIHNSAYAAKTGLAEVGAASVTAAPAQAAPASAVAKAGTAAAATPAAAAAEVAPASEAKTAPAAAQQQQQQQQQVDPKQQTAAQPTAAPQTAGGVQATVSSSASSALSKIQQWLR